MATSKKESEIINIPALDLRYITLKVIGDTPLISHAWSENQFAALKVKMSRG